MASSAKFDLEGILGVTAQPPAFDYGDLSDPEQTCQILGAGNVSRADLYASNTDARYSFSNDQYRGVLEVTSLHPDVLLILNHCRNYPTSAMTQLIGEGSWMHIQFRLRGIGDETLGTKQIDTPEWACLVTSYPGETSVFRRSEASAEQKTACLFMRPSAMQHFFGISANAFPAHLRWIGEGTGYDPQYHLLKLHKASFAAVDDMLACGFTGAARIAYMRAKSTELLAGVVHAMAREALETPSGVKLSSRDIQAVVAAREIMHDRLGETLSLADLATRVGLNRNKLAVGFKRVFDVSVHGYWRELKLGMARDMLRANELSVTEVAWQLGYAETSSFTRAFTARFGISPRAMRSSTAGAELALEQDASREFDGGTILAGHPKMIR